ncbi:MAG: phage tail protein [Dehalococcoidia bacterium]
MTSPRSDPDPYLVHPFALEMGGVQIALFGEITGLQAQSEVFEYKEGGVNTYSHKLPGRTTYTNVTLKWGSTGEQRLWDWYHQVITSTKFASLKKAVSVVQFDAEHREVRRWNLRDAFPVKWVGPNFNSSQSQVSIETLELAYAEFEMVARP